MDDILNAETICLVTMKPCPFDEIFSKRSGNACKMLGFISVVVKKNVFQFQTEAEKES